MPKVLIIDDEPLTINLLEMFLATRGFEVIGAANGHNGLVLAQIEKPDVIILDMMLPDLSGENVCKRLRDDPATSQIPVLILSALFTRITQDKAKVAGANYYMPKHVELPELANQLNRLLAANH